MSLKITRNKFQPGVKGQAPTCLSSGFGRGNVVLGTQKALDWFGIETRAKVLHVFENVCNLINPHGEILSIVNPELGPGPFSIVIENPVDFRHWVGAETPIQFNSQKVVLGRLTISTCHPTVWNPHPRWEDASKVHVRQAVPFIQAELHDSQMHSSIRLEEPPNCNVGGLVNYLVGRGPGLTPAGDDFLVGWLYGMWLLCDYAQVRGFGEGIYTAARGRTTSLSLAWLRAAAAGEAGQIWHALINAIAEGSEMAIKKACRMIIQMGYSSGVDALTGFQNALNQNLKPSVLLVD